MYSNGESKCVLQLQHPSIIPLPILHVLGKNAVSSLDSLTRRTKPRCGLQSPLSNLSAYHDYTKHAELQSCLWESASSSVQPCPLGRSLSHRRS